MTYIDYSMNFAFSGTVLQKSLQKILGIYVHKNHCDSTYE